MQAVAMSEDKRERIMRLYTERKNVLQIAEIMSMPVEQVAQIVKAAQRKKPKGERELVPSMGRPGTPGVSLRKAGLYILAAITEQMSTHTRRCRIKFNADNKLLTIELDPDGLWVINRAASGAGQKRELGKVGGRALVTQLQSEGIEFGTYAAVVVNDGNTVIVNMDRRIG